MAEVAQSQAATALSTPERQTAGVFNVAEYKKQRAAALAALEKQKGKKEKKKKEKKQEKKEEEEKFKTPEKKKKTPLDTSNLKPLMKVKAKYDYTARDETEISFKKGDQITVYGKSDVKGWWICRVRGQAVTALGPANYMAVIKKK